MTDLSKTGCKTLYFFRSFSVTTRVGVVAALVATTPAHAQMASGPDLLQVMDHCLAWADGGFADETPFDADAAYDLQFGVAGQALYLRTGTDMTVEIANTADGMTCQVGGVGADPQGDDYEQLFSRMEARVTDGQAVNLGGTFYALCTDPRALYSVYDVVDGDGLGIGFQWGEGLVGSNADGCDG
ncbi:hypothetical protein [Jannaschia sp. CCS1]|uniref:hypothetical protein n=1 Tax=Jannaschia sp. (strain CCS1) TaxID=290400 RepID=UPI000053CFA4|nr:hypothetical protein [Jannaschia sp. CCS1]ABD56926.1 hypothetical protein Jann_4009 [Jannaschia sp. CCS1]